MATGITLRLIEDPLFEVTLKRDVPEETEEGNVSQRTQKTALSIIEHLGILFGALKDSAKVTCSSLKNSFKIYVLGYHGINPRLVIPNSIYLALIKVIFWIPRVLLMSLHKAGQLYFEKAFPTLIEKFGITPSWLDARHFKTKEENIDVSHVPASVKVSDLIPLFESINFDNPNAPGYMPESTRAEGRTAYSKENLLTHLKKFVQHVEEKVPFLGTPPAEDTPKLLAFYQTIENAVRFSLHKVESDLNTFREKEGEDLLAYSEETLKTYNNLLEDKARVAIDLAIAGAHCGARYMGDAFSVYSYHRGGEIQTEGTLEECLIEVLAHKRKEIAERHASKPGDTHFFSNYMGHMGKILALPGTSNVIEHLIKSFDQSCYLKLFFKEYTEDCVIETIEEAFKKSQELRTKLFDWLKDKKGSWKQGACEEQIASTIASMQTILQSPPSSQGMALLKTTIDLIEHLKIQGCIFPEEEISWNEFVNELFALPAAKQWCEDHLLDPNTPAAKRTLARIGKERALKRVLSEEVLGTELTANYREWILQETPLQRDQFKIQLDTQDTINALQKQLPLDRQTLSRVINNPETLTEVVSHHFERERGVEFLEALPLGDLTQETQDAMVIPSELMEWLLTELHIFHPQIIDEQE